MDWVLFLENLNEVRWQAWGVATNGIRAISRSILGAPPARPAKENLAFQCSTSETFRAECARVTTPLFNGMASGCGLVLESRAATCACAYLST